jgi:hypothetical protein
VTRTFSFRTVALVLGLLAGPAFAAPQSYPLVCRGGGGTLGLNTMANSGLFYFQKASGPAGAGLGLGQCSWVDRAIGPNEPTCLRQTGVNGAAWLFPGNMGQAYISTTNAPWLRSLSSPNTFQTFQVYNPGDTNCFVVTRLGP